MNCQVNTDLSDNLVQKRLDCNCEFCHAIMLSQITIEESKRSDWDYILDLRNSTRQNFGNTDILTKENHYSYLERFTGKIWIVFYGDKRCGFLKLNGSDLAIVLDDTFRGKRFAVSILRMGIQKTDKQLTAVIKIDNMPSLKVYEELGYVRTGQKDGMICLQLQSFSNVRK